MSTNLLKNHWTRDAKCGLDQIILSNHPDDIAKVKEMCRVCPVAKDCAEWTKEIDGSNISAGKTLLERKMSSWKRVEKINESNFR